MSNTMSSYTAAISGLRAAQVGITTTSHNVANADSKGYTRQQNIQADFAYQTIKQQKVGSLKIKTGLGVEIDQIRQIRNKFYDAKFREANSTASYYKAKAEAGEEIQTVFGELETDYTVREIFSDMWNALNDLTSYPDGLETRSNFIQTCNTFMTKVKNVQDSLYEYQLNINEQVKDCVDRINTLVDRIFNLNNKILKYQAEDLAPNDYLDERNLCIDELSSYLNIEVKDEPNGRVQIISEGKELIANGVCEHLGLKYSSTKYPFVVPIISRSEEILGANETGLKELYPSLDTDLMTVDSENTAGKLKGLIIARGNTVADYTTSAEETGNYLIPKTEKYFDTLVNAVVSLINDAVSPKEGEKPADLKGNRTGIEVFVRSSGYERSEEENPEDYNSLYTTSNIEVNPELLAAGGYNYLPISPSGDPGDTDLLNRISEIWKGGVEKLDNMSVEAYYAQFVTSVSIEVEEAANQAEVMTATADVTDNNRTSVSGVSLDEELTTLLKYQYAYQSASKMLSVIDSMVNKVVNEMV